MQSRRSLLARLAAGAGALLLPGGLFARTVSIAPFHVGDPLALGWSIDSLSKNVLTLRHANGRIAQISMRRRGTKPVGIAQTDKLDLVLVNGGEGRARTDEDLARVIHGLAAAIDHA